ncbi:MAG: HisA/HisF-related TIM barrel protein [Bacteroidota bacterium]|nr:HisA/HisF-related TIM barrel protein [Bacteroidota bacterium]
MLVFAAIVLRDGKNILSSTEAAENGYPAEPYALARMLREENARALHIVDLDAALEGSEQNRDVLRAIVAAPEIGIPVEYAGGIRRYEDAQILLREIGVTRIVLTRAAIEEPALVERLVYEFGAKKITVGVEVKEGKLCSMRGARTYAIDPTRHAAHMKRLGIQRIIYTDIAAEEHVRRPDYGAIGAFARNTGLTVTLDGGVRNRADIAALEAVRSEEIDSMIIGRPLYERAFPCQELWALAERIRRDKQSS